MLNQATLQWVLRAGAAEGLPCHEDLNQQYRSRLPLKSSRRSSGSVASAKRPVTVVSCGPRSSSPPTHTLTGTTPSLPGSGGPRWARFRNGASGGEPPERWPKRSGLGRRAFFPSTVRAQITALACTLPRESGRPLSRWSAVEIVRSAIAKRLVTAISASTITRWLREDRIKPWQHRSWQKPTDPRFLQKATAVLRLYEQAHALVEHETIVVCADEKTCIQALKVTGGVLAAGTGKPLRVGARYTRQGILNLFTALLVHKGQTLARCFERKRFVDFQEFCRLLFGSLWCHKIRLVHLILDNGPTHAPKQIKPWIRTLQLPFKVRIHWLPINASWLDQVELVFSTLQRHVLTPRHFENREELETQMLRYLAECNQHPKPIAWSYTTAKLRKHFAPRSAVELALRS